MTDENQDPAEGAQNGGGPPGVTGTELATRLAAFLTRRMPDAEHVEVTDCSRITGGYSCVTHRFTAVVDGKPTQLLARSDCPPGQNVLVSTDRLAEWELLSALTEHGRTPMPAALYCDTDGSELGAKTIVLEYKPGGSFLTRLRATPPEDLPTHADAFAELAAAVHATDLEALPASMERPSDWDAYIDAMIQDWRDAEAEHVGSDPVFRYMATWLDENRPPPAPWTLVHGEYQTSNVVLDNDGRLAAIDWEFAHIGDPREDLGWALFVGAGHQPPDLMGLDLERFCERYRRRSGLSAEVVNPLTVSYFSILPSIRVFRGVLEQQRGLIAGTNLNITTAYVGGVVVTAHEQWLGAAQQISAATRVLTEAST